MTDAKRFRPRIAVVLDAARDSDPAEFTGAVNRELAPLIDALRPRAGDLDLDKVRWILMELVSNAISAPMGPALAEMTGLSRETLLAAFGTNVLWPDLAAAPPAADPRIRAALGQSIPEFLRLAPAEKFRVLGLSEKEDWVAVAVGLPEGDGFETFVESAAPLAPEDAAEIARRFSDFEATMKEIRERRVKYEDAEGIFHMPSFTGGGGYGVLACIVAARKAGLFLDYVPRGDPPEAADFRLATFAPAP